MDYELTTAEDNDDGEEFVSMKVACPDCGHTLDADMLTDGNIYGYNADSHKDCDENRILASLRTAAAVLHNHWST